MIPPATERTACAWGLQGAAGWTICELPAGHDGPHWGLEDLRDGSAPVAVWWGDVPRLGSTRMVAHGQEPPGAQPETPGPPPSIRQRLARSWRRIRKAYRELPPL